MNEPVTIARSSTPQHPLRRLAICAVKMAFRSVVTRVYDPVVRYELDGQVIHLPYSHRLPLARELYPVYSANLGRLAECLAKKYPKMPVIDIGANVGDSVAILKAKVDCPVLCIEGYEAFHYLLQRNTEKYGGVEIVQAYVGKAEEGEKLEWVQTSGGSGRLAQTNGAAAVPLVTLPQAVEAHPAFRHPRLIKIDTDGSDLQIISNELAFLAEERPVVFFEFDPELFAGTGVSSNELFVALREAGYAQATFWENHGDYMLTAPLENVGLLADMEAYFTGRRKLRYADIALFHRDDNDLAEEIRHRERAFFADYRGPANGAK